jgi:ATP-dependent helicase HrpA
MPLISARPNPPTVAAALAELLAPRLGVRIDAALWPADMFPDHLRVRVEVVDNRGQVIGASRELTALQTMLHSRSRDVGRQAATVDNAAWRAARAQWEGEPAAEWKFGDLPAKILVSEHHGVPVHAYPGLKALPAGVAVRLFATPEEAAAASRAGLAKLFETQMRHDLGWLEKDLKALRHLGTLMVTLTTPDALQADALESIRRWVCDPERMKVGVGAAAPNGPSGDATRAVEGNRPYPLSQAAFDRALAGAKHDLRGLVPKLSDWLKEVFTLRLALQTTKVTYPGMAEDLAALLPPDFMRVTPFARLQHLPRYLKGMQARAERAKRDPAKDATRARELAPFVTAVKKLGRGAGELRWLVEEFRVSLFAQELGTAEPVSAVRLERLLQETGRAGPLGPPSNEPGAAPAARPTVAPYPQKKGAPLKSLGALDQLFRK